MVPSIDIHCHILPGVDDGSPDVDTSLAMLKTAISEGTKGMILTPHHKPMHHNVRPDHLIEYTAQLMDRANAKGIDVQLFPGNEIYYSDSAVRELESGRASTLAGSDYVLIEFHPTDMYKTIHNALYTVQSSGYRPILAHVERYADMARHVKYVDELLDMGIYIQVNANSVMGKYGLGIRHFTRELIKRDMVHFVATDAHDNGSRAPHLLDCRDFVESRLGEDFALRIFHDNAMKVLRNEVI
ncbi:CpsB/CapC family capsule biosynthesis tyrosine phosphatase [Butyrivibrio sp. JL13D10]|uniref:CpsB/CapC family capsule biosynthesis tyrosine phosphatase n=1 Tax=Butyrivibrio sp. JL13D10 TaxID=3236815 RepID=UPI0038B48E67